jgi:hypothetical protein
MMKQVLSSRHFYMERPEGDRKGPHPTQPDPRLYYDNGNGTPGSFIVEAGVDAGMRGDPCGRLPASYAWFSCVF